MEFYFKGLLKSSPFLVFYFIQVSKIWSPALFSIQTVKSKQLTAYNTPVDTFYNQIFRDLNFAEALFESGGNENVVRQYVNKVRSRTGVDMPDIADTGDDLREGIRNERRVEKLAFHKRKA